MDNQLISTAVEIVARDLQRSLEFYRLLGLVIPDTDSPHVEVELAAQRSALLGDGKSAAAGGRGGPGGWNSHRASDYGKRATGEKFLMTPHAAAQLAIVCGPVSR
jgi:hypothetical protein